MPPAPARFAPLALALAAVLSACETPTIYEPVPGAAVAERPSFTPGDEFWFHTGGTSILVEEYEGMTDGLHAFRRALQHETVYYSPDMSVVRIERRFAEHEAFDPDNGELAFPLSVGKTWTRTYRVRNERTVFVTERTRSCEVLDLGRVNSQAGQFPAYRIACRFSELGETPLTQTEVLYAPAVGRIVRSRSLGRGTTLNLIEFTRAQ